jgi:hypothetical protein
MKILFLKSLEKNHMEGFLKHFPNILSTKYFLKHFLWSLLEISLMVLKYKRFSEKVSLNALLKIM